MEAFILIVNIFSLHIIVKQKQTRSNKGFNFDILFSSKGIEFLTQTQIF